MTETSADGSFEAEVSAFWAEARRRARLSQLPGYFGPTALESLQPPAWSFGGTATQADELLALVLEGTKTATASALWDYEAAGEPVPSVGGLGIVLDGGGHPRALLATTRVDVVPFDEVGEEHAFLEGEGDRSLRYWREVHERFFTTYAAHGRGFSPTMPVVLERFAVLYQR
ncbi:ASCH domain-containing protein [Nocardioides sp. DS6]|uniref:ASCH domain-containing protein n=1 Tax=Nocardioides eburneus TaxID=3231482 RepID=A0ABV3T0Y4_9ACTN